MGWSNVHANGYARTHLRLVVHACTGRARSLALTGMPYACTHVHKSPGLRTPALGQAQSFDAVWPNSQSNPDCAHVLQKRGTRARMSKDISGIESSAHSVHTYFPTPHVLLHPQVLHLQVLHLADSNPLEDSS